MTTSTNGSAISLGICSDTHFWFDGQNFEGESLQLQGHSELLFETLLSELEKADLDLFVHLGDITSGGGTFQMSQNDFYTTLQRASIGFQQLKADAYALPGNHDCLVGDSWSHFGEIWSLPRGEGKTIDVEQARLVLLNTQGHSTSQIQEAKPTDPVYGWVSTRELARLEEALATAGGKPVILFSHQLLKPWIIDQSIDHPWKPFYGVLNQQGVADLMAKYNNVRAVFQGHAHRLDVQIEKMGANQCTFVVLPSLIEYPLGWLKLTIAKGNLDISLQRLPLHTLAEQSKMSGDGQGWRCGQPEWHNFSIAL